LHRADWAARSCLPGQSFSNARTVQKSSARLLFET
jgi:hypothetical protein